MLGNQCQIVSVLQLGYNESEKFCDKKKLSIGPLYAGKDCNTLKESKPPLVSSSQPRKLLLMVNVSFDN